MALAVPGLSWLQSHRMNRTPTCKDGKAEQSTLNTFTDCTHVMWVVAHHALQAAGTSKIQKRRLPGQRCPGTTESHTRENRRRNRKAIHIRLQQQHPPPH